ncbi:MAG: fasciclin domain-containing protein [Microscillaceae bacterium]|nr:fasciclin domain-containing protein [Microscillaceae bacterium]MDW8461710.1 fasciclin domain-containing protein [Cytophagales bacterium]
MRRMMIRDIHKILAVLLLVVISFFACRRVDETKLSPSVLDLPSMDPELSMFAQAIQRTGVKKTIGFPLISLLAPTNQAFQAAGITDVNTVDLTTLTNIVNYHIINTNIDSARFDIDYWGILDNFNNNAYQTLNFAIVNAFVYFNHRTPNVPQFGYTTSPVPNGLMAFNGANVVRPNGILRGAEGTMFKIERVLFPPAGLLSEMIAANPDLSLFNRAIRRATATGQTLNFAINPLHLGALPTPAQAGSGTTAARQASRTVFAPNNAAMLNAGLNEATIDAYTPTALFDIVARHVIAERCFTSFYFPAPATNSNQPTLRTGTSINVVVNDAGVNVGIVGSSNPRANVIVPNRIAVNGIIHIIDRVMQ